MREFRFLKSGFLLFFVVALVLVAAACGGEEEAPEGKAKGKGVASYNFGTLRPNEFQEARAGAPVETDVPNFGGVTLTMMGDAGHNLNPVGFWVPEWKNAGLTLKVIEVPFADVYSKEKAEFVAGGEALDLAVFYPAFIGDFASNGHLEPLDDLIEKYDPNLDDVISAFRELYLKWDGQVYALPIDGDVHMLIYRKDLLNHPEEQAAFKKQYGRELTVPETWDEWLEVGEFFTRKPGEKLGDDVLKRPFYGCAEYGQRGFSWAWFMNRFASAGGVYFDEEMNPQINSDTAVKSLENMVQSVKTCSPPDVLNFGYDQLRDVLIKGNAFMVVQWTDVPKKGADPAQSDVAGKLGYARLPGTMIDGELNTRSMMPVGRVVGVVKGTENAEAAYWVAKFLSDDTSLFNVSTPLTGLDPYRSSHIEPSAYTMFEDPEDAKAYLDTVQAVLEVGFPEIYIPGAAQYADALDLAVNKVIAGQLEPKEALDQAADEWNRITDGLDRDRQIELWKSALETYRDVGLIVE